MTGHMGELLQEGIESAESVPLDENGENPLSARTLARHYLRLARALTRDLSSPAAESWAQTFRTPPPESWPC